MEGNQNKDRRGMMIVLSSPSGAGKTSLSRELLKENKNLFLSISYTTRPPRPLEVNENDYFFVSNEKFIEMLNKGEFLEHAKVFDNYYGSSKKLVIEKLNKGKNIIFDIDWQGTRQIRNKNLEYKLVTIYILPPSKKELLNRLIKREKKNLKTVKKRMKEFKKDLSKWKEYDQVVINDDLKKCYNVIMKAIKNNKIQFDKELIKKHVNKLLS